MSTCLRGRRRRAVVLLILATAASACGGSSTGPSPAPLTLTCPSRVDGQAADPAGVAVQYEVTVQGGRQPAPVVCTPPSGSTFPVGSTSVSCSVTDAASQNAGCTFPVLVTAIPRLRWTRFVAFGDSITEGVTSPAPNILSLVGLPDSYPGQLEQLLTMRYSAQTITMINRGVAGERLAQGRDRLPGVLDEDRPEVLLLLEGVNNILNVPTKELAGDLDDMVREARRRNIEVLLATLLPISDSREAGRPGTQRAIEELNDEIFDIARKNGIGDPVDLFTVFRSTPNLLGQDGLHPTAAGYVRMAEVFFETIRARYEIQPDAPDSIVVGAQFSSGGSELSMSPSSASAEAGTSLPARRVSSNPRSGGWRTPRQ